MLRLWQRTKAFLFVLFLCCYGLEYSSMSLNSSSSPYMFPCLCGDTNGVGRLVGVLERKGVGSRVYRSNRVCVVMLMLLNQSPCARKGSIFQAFISLSFSCLSTQRA